MKIGYRKWGARIQKMKITMIFLFKLPSPFLLLSPLFCPLWYFSLFFPSFFLFCGNWYYFLLVDDDNNNKTNEYGYNVEGIHALPWNSPQLRIVFCILGWLSQNYDLGLFFVSYVVSAAATVVIVRVFINNNIRITPSLISSLQYRLSESLFDHWMCSGHFGSPVGGPYLTSFLYFFLMLSVEQRLCSYLLQWRSSTVSH